MMWHRQPSPGMLRREAETGREDDALAFLHPYPERLTLVRFGHGPARLYGWDIELSGWSWEHD